MKQRTHRLAELIHRELGTILRYESRDERFKDLTITGVRMTDDLGLAKVYFTAVADQRTVPELTSALNRAQGFFRSKLSERVTLKYMPELKFYYDEHLVNADRIEQLFKEIRNAKES
jgi:ribosome-binding factor A